ncbi:MAG: peptidoglycan DD-metalloendopeptidase family protein [Rubrivivax sp.]
MTCRPPRGIRVTLQGAASAVLLVLLAGCGSTSHRAPVEDRVARSSTPAPAPAPTPAPVVVAPVAGAASAVEPTKVPPPGAENAGKPGYFTVRPGDTMIRIGLETGQNWRDIVRWNNIDNPNVIEVGQVLRVAPPPPDPNAAVTKPVAPAGRVDARPLGASAAAGAPAVVPAPPANGGASSPPATREGDEELGWMWPAAGSVIGTFDENRSKGLEIAGKAGDPVLAAADGRVVYAGSGLRGYGNLIIVKHNANYLSAYAHNQSLLVKEDQVVRKGQKIAEMGSSDAERVQLHFEIRRQGKPIDPARLLPPR